MFKEPKKMDILNSFADIGATIAENFEVEKPLNGNSFLSKLI
jgi:phosphopentomutase